MFDLHKFFTNPFDDPGISMEELLAFTTNNLARMTLNNPGGVFTARIAATEDKLAGVSDAFTDDQTKLGLRKARKRAKDAFRAALPDNISKIYVVITAKFGLNGVEVTECFPQGRRVFHTATDDMVKNHLETLINGVTAHQAQLSAQTVTEATALLTAWNAVYGVSETSSSAKTSTEGAKRAARAALQMELFITLLTIANTYPAQPEKLDEWMQPSLLMDHPQQPPAPTPPAPTPPPGP